jgi:hypothetical protein
LSKGNGRLSCIPIRQAGCARAIDQLAEQVPIRAGIVLALLLVMASRNIDFPTDVGICPTADFADPLLWNVDGPPRQRTYKQHLSID